MLAALQKANPHLSIEPAENLNATNLGTVYAAPQEPIAPLLAVLRALPFEGDGVTYVASESGLEAIEAHHTIARRYFGEMKVQSGYCIGHNSQLNALEYHKGTEVLLAATAQLLLLCGSEHIKDQQIDPTHLRGFLVQAGSLVEIFPRTLHFAPIQVAAEGFRAGILLPCGTNHPLNEPALDPLLFGRNKWLFAHAESPQATAGAHVGLRGNKIRVNLPQGPVQHG